jgi:hypothetical protein
LYFVHDAEFDPAELRTVVDHGLYRMVCQQRHFLAGKALAATGQPPPCGASAGMNLFFGDPGRPGRLCHSSSTPTR